MRFKKISPMSAYDSKFPLKDKGDNSRDGGIIAVLPNGHEAHIQPVVLGGRPRNDDELCAVCIMTKDGDLVRNLHDGIAFKEIDILLDVYASLNRFMRIGDTSECRRI